MTPLRLPLRMLALGLVLAVAGGCVATPQADQEDTKALRAQIQTLETRVRAVESRREQIPAVVANARAAVALVWGTYTFVDTGGRPLRHVLNEVGEPVADPQGVPLVDLTGTGPIAVTDYTGTAFLVGRRGELLTNRHVAQPWWEDEASAPLLAAGLRPVFLRLRAFFQERVEAVPIEVLRVDAEQDIALVRTVGWVPSAEPLSIHPRADQFPEGQPVILIGYPTGLEAVLAKLDTLELIALEAATGADNYAMTERLAEAHRLRPTTTGGFLWEALPHMLVYDAQTTGGGSGGPLLDRQGRVIGVNTAYLPDFRGGNFGVPIRFGQALLDGRGIQSGAPARETPDLVGHESPVAKKSLERLQGSHGR
jgi:S1-C subfamily serine protease